MPIDESILGIDIYDFFEITIEADFGGVNFGLLMDFYDIDKLSKLLKSIYSGFLDLRKHPSKEIINQRASIDKMSDNFIEFFDDYDFETKIYEAKGKYGLKDCLGKILVEANFDKFSLLSDQEYKKGDRLVAYLNGKCGIIIIGDNFGQWLLEPHYDYIGIPNYYTNVYKDGKAGVFCSGSRTWLLKLEMDKLDDNNGFLFCNGLAFYEKDGKQGIIMASGEYTSAIYDEIEYDIEDIPKVRIGNSWGFAGENGKLVQDEDDAYFYAIID
jgi:hypothetical protein